MLYYAHIVPYWVNLTLTTKLIVTLRIVTNQIELLQQESDWIDGDYGYNEDHNDVDIDNDNDNNGDDHDDDDDDDDGDEDEDDPWWTNYVPKILDKSRQRWRSDQLLNLTFAEMVPISLFSFFYLSGAGQFGRKNFRQMAIDQIFL